MAFGVGSESFTGGVAQTANEVSSPIFEAEFSDFFCSFVEGSDLRSELIR